ncbi:MAG: response regulator [Acidobacteriota bacterium]
MPQGSIVAVLDDLFFTVKIHEAAKRSGVPITFVKSEIDALQQAQNSPDLIILDLNCTVLDPFKVIAALKSDPNTKMISLLGYVSHVQGELKLQAQQAGCDMVLARSAFSQNLPVLLKRYTDRR